MAPLPLLSAPTYLIMTPAEAQHRFLQGLQLYWRGFFWHAHEVWEEVWASLPPSAQRDALKGLIQLCALLIHAQKHHAAGCRRLARRIRTYLRAADHVFLLPLAPVRKEFEAFWTALEEALEGHRPPLSAFRLRPRLKVPGVPYGGCFRFLRHPADVPPPPSLRPDRQRS